MRATPTDFLIKHHDLVPCLVLTYNIFEHDSQLYQQLIGVSMGTKVGPSVADIFMSFIDQDIKKKALNFAINNTSPLSFFKRFLDDILMLWTDSYENLQSSQVPEGNQHHPSFHQVHHGTHQEDRRPHLLLLRLLPHLLPHGHRTAVSL